jgi:hypothetical protein
MVLRTMNYEGWKRRNEGKIEKNGHLGHKGAKVLTELQSQGVGNHPISSVHSGLNACM